VRHGKTAQHARLFDAYIMVDWSAAAKPTLSGQNSIWIASLAKDAPPETAIQGRSISSTRLEAARLPGETWSAKLTRRGDPVAFWASDFSGLGYSRGTGESPWLTLSTGNHGSQMLLTFSSRAESKADNSNARYASAAGHELCDLKGNPTRSWGAHARERGSLHLRRTKRSGQAAARIGLLNPICAKQETRPRIVLAACLIPAAVRQPIADRHPARPRVGGRPWPNARIWPFETGTGELNLRTTLQGVEVVHGEILSIPGQGKSGKQARRWTKVQVSRNRPSLFAVTKRPLGSCFPQANRLTREKIEQIQAERGLDSRL